MKNKKIVKEEANNLEEACLRKADELAKKYPHKKFTVWEIVSNVLSEASGYDVHFLTLKADMDIIKFIAEGLSVSSIANRLSIPSQHVFDVAKIWGMDIMDSTLDFNPMFVYHDGMTAQELEMIMNDVLPIPITPHGADVIIHNIEKYNDFVKFIKEYDYEKG